jgi:hypothetical protein
MIGECSTHEEEEVCIEGIGGKGRKKETTRKRGAGRRIILE